MLAHVTTPLVNGSVPPAKRRKIAEITTEITHDGGHDAVTAVASAAATPAPAVGVLVPSGDGFDTEDDAVYDVNGELKKARSRRDRAEITPRFDAVYDVNGELKKASRQISARSRRDLGVISARSPHVTTTGRDNNTGTASA